MDSVNLEAILYPMIRRLLSFPFPTICRHSVALDLLSLLEEHGYKVDPELIAATSRADDTLALQLLI